MIELYQVELSYACYGIVVVDGVVTEAPPIARWMIGKTVQKILWWVLGKIGSMKVIDRMDGTESWLTKQ
jgi:hypothetical protein